MKSEKRKMSRRRMVGVVWAMVLTLSVVINAQAQNPITVSLVPYGGSVVTGGQQVAVEAFLTANEDITLMPYGRTDLPCSLPGQPGASGTITTSYAVIGPNGFPLGSIGGIPYLFVIWLYDFNPSTCLLEHRPATPGLFSLSSGDLRYLGTFYYNVSDCALGGFDVFFQSQTGFFNDCCPLTMIPMDIVNAVLVVPGGTCCIGGVCLADNINEFCCQQTYPGARWIEGRSCADAIPCPDCVLDEECDDAVFCNGAEWCDTGPGTCQLSFPPTCDDGIACTIDTCDALSDECMNSPSNAACDDGLFCNGVESCDSVAGCVAGEASCTGSVPVDGTQVFLDCDEAADACVVALIPTVSTWGLVTLALVVLTLAKLRRASLPAPSSR